MFYTRSNNQLKLFFRFVLIFLIFFLFVLFAVFSFNIHFLHFLHYIFSSDYPIIIHSAVVWVALCFVCCLLVSWWKNLSHSSWTMLSQSLNSGNNMHHLTWKMVWFVIILLFLTFCFSINQLPLVKAAHSALEDRTSTVFSMTYWEQKENHNQDKFLIFYFIINHFFFIEK